MKTHTLLLNASSSSVKFFLQELADKRNERNHGSLHEMKVKRTWNPVKVEFTPVLSMDRKFQQYDVEVVK